MRVSVLQPAAPLSHDPDPSSADEPVRTRTRTRTHARTHALTHAGVDESAENGARAVREFIFYSLLVYVFIYLLLLLL